MRVIARLLAVLSTVAACQSDYEGGIELPNGYVRATLPVVKSGITYADVDAPEVLPWGPAGIFSVKDGYAIPDSVRGKIIILNDDFGVTREIDVRGVAQGVLAVVSDGGDLVALDAYAPVPRLLRIGPGNVVKSVEVQTDQSTAPTGLARDDIGLLLEFDGGASLYRIEDRDGVLRFDPADGYVWGGNSYSVDKPKNLYSHERIVRIGSGTGVVRVPNHLGSAQIVGPDGDGGTYVLVEDVTHAETISVEQTLWHFSSGGEALSVAKVPLRERIVYTAHGLTLDKNREPIAIVPVPNELQFWTLAKVDPSAITSRQVSTLPDTSEIERSGGLSTPSQGLTTYDGTCLTSSQMAGNVNEYLSASMNMVSNNVYNNGTCTGRTRPNYLAVGVNTSVSYDWGGWDTPAGFISAVSGGGKAGNIPQNDMSPSLACSYGVDCSGFATRVWGFTDRKRGTCSFSEESTSKGPSYGPAYYVGDAFALCGSHVVLYSGPATNGFNLWESAVEPYARVVSRFSSWGYVSGYSAWRSRTSCN